MEEPPETFEEFTPRAVSSMAQGESVDIEPTLMTPQTGPEEPEKPIGPLLSVEKVISETEDILQKQLNITLDRRRFMRLVYFKVEGLQKTLEEEYKSHLDRINTFLVKNDKLQENWMRSYLVKLPSYGDYSLVLENSPNLINVEEIPKPVKEASLKSLVEEVTNGLYASAMQVRAMRTQNEAINSNLNLFRKVCDKNYFQYNKWTNLCKLQLDNLEFHQEECFKEVSNIDFNDLNKSGSSTDTQKANSQ